MATCGVCKNPCNDTSDVKCSGCEGVFHLECIKQDLEGRVTRSTKDWKCKNCRKRAPSTQGSGTSTSSGPTLTKDFLVRVIEEFKNQVFGEFKSFRNELEELKNSMQFLSDKVDSNNNLMQEIKNEFSDIKKENEQLHARNKLMNEHLVELQNKVRNLEQYSRRSNVEISGIPSSPNEDVTAIVKDVGSAIGLAIQPGDVAAAHRIPTYKKDRIPSIVVQFRDRGLRDVCLTKFKEKKSMSANQVNKQFPQHQRVYVNEHLTPENKLFLSNLKKKGRELNYAFVWCREGKFFIRKNEGGKVQRVNSIDEVEKLK